MHAICVDITRIPSLSHVLRLVQLFCFGICARVCVVNVLTAVPILSALSAQVRLADCYAASRPPILDGIAAVARSVEAREIFQQLQMWKASVAAFASTCSSLGAPEKGILKEDPSIFVEIDKAVATFTAVQVLMRIGNIHAFAL